MTIIFLPRKLDVNPIIDLSGPKSMGIAGHVGSKLLPLIVFILVSSTALAQDSTRVALSGVVVDDSTGVPIAGANVFLSNTLVGVSADTMGHFVLRNVFAGTYELVVSHVGYQMRISSLSLPANDNSPVTIRLLPKMISLGAIDVVAPRDNRWADRLNRVKKLLLGTTPEASQCKVLNPEVMDISVGSDNEVTVRSEKELVVDNLALGYRIYLTLGTLSLSDRWLTTAYNCRYEQLAPTSKEQQAGWLQARSDAYKGSLRHFLVALSNGTLAREGFAAFASPVRTVRSTNRLFEFNEDDLTSKVASSRHILRFPQFLVIDYDRIRVRARSAEESTDLVGTRPLRSVVSLEKDSVIFTSHGQIFTPFALKVSGDWAMEGLARQLPLEYDPRSR